MENQQHKQCQYINQVTWGQCKLAVNRVANLLWFNDCELDDYVLSVWKDRLPTALKLVLLDALVSEELKESKDTLTMVKYYKQLKQQDNSLRD